MIKPEELVKESNLDFSKFHCCGDKDLYPFKCSNCNHIMVFCYECDTLHDDLDELNKNSSYSGNIPINSFDPHTPIFPCPKCGYKFEYFFMKNGKYKVSVDEWISKKYEDFLTRN